MSGNTEAAETLASSAIALMAKHAVPPVPENFHLFYEYASAANVGLRKTMDGIAAARQPFTPLTLQDLRTRFLAGSEAERILAEFGAIMDGTLTTVLNRIASAERDTAAYGQALSVASGQLGAEGQQAELHKLVGTLLAATQVMESRTRDLEAELQRSSSEVEQLKTKLDDVRKETLTDPLTGIANRKAFDMELARAIERVTKSGDPLSLFMCDVDRFKRFNDTWGHQTGDQVLKLVANCLSENVKGRDTAARYGGEEFAVVVSQTALADAVALANSIRTRVESKKLVKKSTKDILGVITISIGVAQFAPGETAESFVQRADTCLYAAKSAGRNLVVAQTTIPATCAA